MYNNTLAKLDSQAKQKHGLFDSSPLRYFLAAMLAGAYVGVGSIVLFSVGDPFYQVSSPFLSVVTGATFGLALALVLWAGSELFTGNHLIFTASSLSGTTTWKQTASIWGWSFVGNLVGALLLSYLVFLTGIFADAGANHYMVSLAADKMNAPLHELLFRGILCNWIVCLAIWTSLRAEGDIAKLFLIFVLIFAFIASGFEHSVANMSLLGMALFHGGSDMVTISGFFYNLIPVTIGNVIGGALFVAGAYVAISQKKNESSRKQVDKKSG
ncbi:formate/nitrite transporter family protein [Shouchella clausii]|uniref:formate/nitrite transporter family protein n=2 Tax=Shouchella clausii TaxID=79880 RepID=UPI000B96CEB3|nr:formate/nitrite transporter family protein [Shouchella clausii]AST94782.1 nitrite transporter NirC [Shouchella clausii]MEB5474750.1 formate/nitrite transporter family protein [Shouchella clausii]QNM45222.1 formate/nitrite transporter family protein [Shouchella clausii]WQG96058.1 formate/nitrite transporter family protein [Shouchella clausii]